MQEDKTSTIELHEETDYLVQAMIQFLYTARCQMNNYQVRSRGHCDHSEEEAHSYSNPACHRWIYGFDLAIYNMGDKYDIPGLRVYACFRLREDLDYPYAYLKEKDWSLTLDIMEALYDTSHTNEELWRILIGEIEDAFMVSHLSCRSEFYVFLLRAPDVADHLRPWYSRFRSVLEKDTFLERCPLIKYYLASLAV